MKPMVERVERASGHRTVRLHFGEGVVESARSERWRRRNSSPPTRNTSDSLDRTKVREDARRIVSTIRAIGFPYRRTDRPHRRVVEVNVALLSVTAGFASRAFGKGGLTDEARKWVSQAVWQEKQRTGRDAGVVVDLLDAHDCPWAADGA